jgi:hypothetical protein
MTIDQDLIGRSAGAWKVTVERSVSENLARALGITDPLYFDRDAARAGGYANVLAPPTLPFLMANWGVFADDQPEGFEHAPNLLRTLLDAYMSDGGLILHGEQSFHYTRPIVAGDVLIGERRITDVYEKATAAAKMTFIVTETHWSDAATGEPVVTAGTTLINRVAAT